MLTRTCSDRSFKALMLTQFLSALNDNLFRVVLTLLVVSTISAGENHIALLVWLNILFISPFLLFSSLAGGLADRLSKSVLIRYLKVFEIFIMGLGLVFFLARDIQALLVVLFLLGVHNSLLSPAKYGILPELLDEENLSKGNGYLQFWAFLAMIVGSALGGMVAISEGGGALPGICAIAVAVGGWLASNFIGRVEPAGAREPLRIGPQGIAHGFSLLRKEKALMLTALAIAYFWGIAALYQLNLVLYAKQYAAWSDVQLSLLLAGLGVGVGIGSLVAGFVSEGKVELGLVPLGALGLGVLSAVLGVLPPSYPMSFTVLLFLGLSAGFFIVPLNAYLQDHTPVEKRGHCLAALNVMSFISMLFCSLVLLFFIDVLEISPARLFLLVGITTVAVAFYICKLLPEVMIRCLNWVLIHTIYRLKVVGREQVPRTGGALLVCNHLSYVDAQLVLASIDRPVRFMMYKPIYEHPLINPVAKVMGAIPVHSGTSREDVNAALGGAADAIRSGELVCIFAEGAISRVGSMLKFKRGLERIMEGVDAPIIPMHIDQVWGSVFSYKGGRFFWKLPEKLPYPVTISYGAPLPPNATRQQVRHAVQELSSAAFPHRGNAMNVLHRSFIRRCKRGPFAPCVSDSTGKKLNRQNTLTGALLFAERIRELGDDQEMVGVFLPSGVGSVLVNLGALLAGKVSVNLNYTAGEESLRSAVTQCGIRTILTSSRFVEKLPLPEALRESCRVVHLEELERSFSFGEKLSYWLAALLLPSSTIERMAGGGEKATDDPATVIFSSGSTGEPKGVVLSHGNISSNVTAIRELFPPQREECLLGVLPFFHSFGYTGTLWLPLLAGVPVVYHFNPLEAGTVGKLVKQHRATILMSTPTFLSAYTRKCTPEQFQSLKLVMVGAEKLKGAIRDAFETKFGATVLEGYGCTELSPLAIANSHDAGEGRAQQVGNKPGTVGHPVPGVAVRVVDPDDMRPLNVGVEGLLLVKGPNVMKGYLDRPELTAEVIKDGWYVTGDIAKLDDDGFVTITDRLSRFSKIAGEMVPHILIEDKIHEVLEEAEAVCAVTAVPDEKKGERLVVLATKPLDGAALAEHLAQGGLPNLWIPRPEHYYQIESLPLLGSGKLDLKALQTIALTLASGSAESLP